MCQQIEIWRKNPHTNELIKMKWNFWLDLAVAVKIEKHDDNSARNEEEGQNSEVQNSDGEENGSKSH